MRVAKLNRPHCNDMEHFVDDGIACTVEDCTDFANHLNIKYYTDRDHYYAVVDDQYMLKNQPHITADDMAEVEMDDLLFDGSSAYS